MELYGDYPVLFFGIATILVLVAVSIFEFCYIAYAGTPVPVPDIPRNVQTLGGGRKLTYAILGDSTAVGQGGYYERGIAWSTALYMAQDRQVQFQNFAISGARASDVLHGQTEQARALRPDVVLLAVGANDVTHLTPLGEVKRDITSIIDRLYGANPAVKIILTGSPQMGSVPRFPWPANYYAKVRTERINKIMVELAHEKRVVFAPIAAETGPIFYEHPELFADDLFHPNTAGYDTWVAVLKEALDKAGLGA